MSRVALSNTLLTSNTQGKPIIPNEIENRQNASQRVRYELPKYWNKKDLSPSLLPPPRKGYDWSNVGQWG
jgi:hypothetical protein